jgi:outer membrane protein OmpA-like peptidoglycan-associated protein
MHIEKSIRDACGVSEAKTFFAFDSAVILQADLPLMEKLSNCFEGGALDGRNLNIVGFTDPRGEDAYNWDLGEQRAQSVKELLTSGGVKDSRIHVSSRGERDATGYDEAGWSKDRRVDLSLRD